MKSLSWYRWIAGAVVLLTAAAVCCGDKAPDESVVAAKPDASTGPAARPDTSPAKPAELPHKAFLSLDQAIDHILKESDPLVIGFGEVHQLEGTVKIESAVERFSKWVVPALKDKTSDLVVETWINLGQCGEQEKKVHKDLDKTTERPETTESEVVRLLRRAKQVGIEPHILEFKCQDYEALLADGGEVDYFEMLGLITRGLERKAEGLISRAQAPGQQRAVAVFGGAIHNDLAPLAELETFSYAATLKSRARGRYVEIDLLVPEFVETSEPFRQQPWFDQFQRLATAKRVVVIKRAEGSYIIALRRGVQARPPGQNG
jgi:hypothetical protein